MPNIATISGNMLTESVVDLATLPSGSGTSGYLPKWATTTSLGNSLVFDNGTQIGIGTTSPAYTLDVRGSIFTNNNIWLSDGVSATHSTIFVPAGYSGRAIRIGNNGYGGGFIINPTEANARSVLTSSYDQLYVESNFVIRGKSFTIFDSTFNTKFTTAPTTGNTIIGGGTAAGFMLDVQGTTRITGATGINAAPSSSTATFYVSPLTYNKPGVLIKDNVGGFNNAFQVQNFSSEVIFDIGLANGQTAIGTTYNSNAYLTINQKTYGPIGLVIKPNTTGFIHDLMQLQNSTGTVLSGFSQAGRLFVGNVAPTNSIHIDSGNATASYLQFTAGTTTGQTASDGFEVGIDGSGNGIINQQENLPISLLTNNTERLLVKADGTSVFSENVRIKVTKKLRFAFYDNDTATDGMEFYLSNTPQAFIACPFIPALNISVYGGSIATFGSSSLTLRGDLSISGGTGGSIVNTGSFRNYLLQSNGAGTIGRTAASPAYSFYGDGSTGIWSPSTGVVGFSISGAEAMRLSSASNLLIGTTTDAGQKLQVSGTSSLGGDVVITTTTNARTLTIARGSSTNSINFQSSTGEFSFQNQGSHVIQVGNGTFQHASSRLTFSGFQNASYIEFKESSSNSQIFYIKNGDTQQWNWAKNLKIDGSTAASECAASSILELSSTTKGFLPPRMTAVQAEAISTPAEGLMVYATTGTGVTITSKGWWGYDGAAWVKLN